MSESSSLAAEPPRDVPVEGMHCAGCVQSVETLLRATAGIDEAHVNFGTQRARIAGTATLATLDARLAKGGYRLGDRSTQLPAGVEADAVRAVDGVLEVEAQADGLAVRHVDERHVLAALRALLPEGAALETEADPRARRLDRAERSWRLRFVLAAAIAVFLMLASMTAWLPDTLRGGATQLLLALVAVLGAGGPILAGAFAALRRGRADMDVLIALGTLTALGASAAVVAGWADGPLYFESSAMIVAFVALGRWLEARARRATGSAVDHLMHLEPETALVVTDATSEPDEIPLARLLVGDQVLVRPGGRVPADGVVRSGTSRVDESLLTGESVPVAKEEGAVVHAGTANGTGALTVEVRAVGADTTLRRIAAWVERAQAAPAPVARVADRVAAVFVPCVLAVAALVFLGWWLLAGDVEQGLAAAVAVLVIACPCALGLATPTAIVVGTGRAAALGILLESGAAIERAARVRTVVFDKTGTLTSGQTGVGGIVLHGDTGGAFAGDIHAMVAHVAAIERQSEHPLARAIMDFARMEHLDVPPCEHFEAVPGGGARGHVHGLDILVGNAEWFDAQGIDHETLLDWRLQVSREGATALLVAVDGALAGGLAVRDHYRGEARPTFEALAAQGLEVRVLSGDAPEVVARAAQALGIEAHLAEGGVRPEEKAAYIQALDRVAMVGDGINDAPALASADVGIAVGGATDVAGAAASIALMRDSLQGVPVALALCRRTLRTIHENLIWAFGYNALAIPLAAFGVLPPMVAAGAMALSSVSVVLNSLRLRHAALGPGTFSDA